ncbi:MAG: regulatory protein RecX [Eubacteriales bacterium]|nr:regulatory protein RecX [Eubacteriales bacterium]
MDIISIEEKGKTKYRITTQDGVVFVMTKREAALYGIRGTESVEKLSLPEEMWEALWAGLYKAAIRRCGDLLKGRDYTRTGLLQKLREDEYPEEIALQAVRAMEEAHYVDDRRFAQTYLHYHLQDRSRGRIRQDLRQKGVPAEVIEEAFAEAAEEENLEERELGQIRALLEKKRYDPRTADWPQKQKMMAFLYRRGFSQELIRRAVEE